MRTCVCAPRPDLPLRSTFPACNTALPLPLPLSVQEMHEFSMDDSSRVGWDPMLKSAWLLASGKDVAHTAEQLVVYLRRCEPRCDSMRQQHRAGVGGSGMLGASTLCRMGQTGRNGAMHIKCDMQATTWVACSLDSGSRCCLCLPPAVQLPHGLCE